MKKNNRHIYLLMGVLLLVGSTLCCYRHFFLDIPWREKEQITSWMVEANLRFTAYRNVPVKAQFAIPYMPPFFSILDEYFISQDYGVTTSLNGYNRYALWSLRRGSGPQSLYYRAIFRETHDSDTYLPTPPLVKAKTLADDQKTAVQALINKARAASADIQTFAQTAVKELNKRDGNAKVLVGDNFSDDALVRATVMVLNQAKIFALPIEGIYLSQQTKAEFQLWLAVYNEKEWVYINPHTGATGLPKHFLVWKYGDTEPMYQVTGGNKPSLAISVSPTPMNALTLAKARGVHTDSKLLQFSLLQLPVHAQEVYKILLTVPIGAFIILLLRNFIGLSTFGTFMPVLIALAFRETHVLWGITLFTIIVSSGLLIRFYLDHLRLLLVPRLTAILTVVILLMLAISVFSQNLGFDSGLSVALFPLVILTMTIERMCITWDERGPYEAIKAGVGSLIAATLCYSVMSYPPLQYLVFAFPELLLILLALVLWCGQYRGYRLTELFRFNALARIK